MKAIISPYEHLENILYPSVIIDLKVTTDGIVEYPSFNSSDIPDGIIDASNAERLIFLDDTAHAQAVSLGYVEVDV